MLLANIKDLIRQVIVIWHLNGITEVAVKSPVGMLFSLVEIKPYLF